MRFSYEVDVSAPVSHVRHVLDATDEYPSWSLLAYDGPDGVHLAVPVLGDRRIHLRVGLESRPDATVVTVGRGTSLRIQHRIAATAVGRSYTRVSVVTSTSGPLALLCPRAKLLDDLRTFVADAAGRAHWLRQAPDTAFEPAPCVAPSAVIAAEGLDRLRQHARELDGGVLAFDAAASCWLIDPAGRRFMRATLGEDPSTLTMFADWQALTKILVEGDDLVLTPQSGSPVRICGALRSDPAPPRAERFTLAQPA